MNSALLLSVVCGLAVVVYFVYRHKQREQWICTIGDELGVASDSTGKKRAHYNNLQYSFSYHPGSRGSQSFLRVTADCRADVRVSFTPEKTAHRFFKLLGIAVEVQAGDRNFDEFVYVESSQPQFVQHVLENARLRGLLVQCFEMGVSKIEVGGGYLKSGQGCITIERSPYKVKRDETLAHITEVLPLLECLHAELGEEQGRSELPGRRQRGRSTRHKEAWLYAALSVFGALSIGSFFYGYEYFKPFALWESFLYSLSYSIALTLLCCAFVVFWVKGMSSAHRTVPIGWIVSLSCSLLLCWGSVMWINGEWDASEKQSHEVPIVKKYYSRNKNSTSYFLIGASWDPQIPEVKLKVSRARYDRVHPGRTLMRVVTGKGYLNYEWISSYEEVRSLAIGPQ